MKIATLYEANASDIPNALRLLAEEIASGEVLATSVALVIRTEDGEVEVRALGKTDSCRAFMDLHAGAQDLLR